MSQNLPGNCGIFQPDTQRLCKQLSSIKVVCLINKTKLKLEADPPIWITCHPHSFGGRGPLQSYLTHKETLANESVQGHLGEGILS